MNNEIEINKVLKEFDAELLPDTETHILRISVKSESSNRKYIVSKRDSSGNFECSCPGWTMHSPRRNCKHLNAMVPALEEVQKLLLSSPKKIEYKTATTKKKVVKKAVKVTNSVAKKEVT